MTPVPTRGIHRRAWEMGTEEITNRLRRIEGQIRGLQRMVEEQRDCESILTQLMAARAALDRVGLLVAESFVQECVLTADGDLARQRVGRVLELVFSRFSVPTMERDAAPGDLVKPSTEE
jgi:CsoR family transcriptional regulator, copper-sensing transcriptional repressor